MKNIDLKVANKLIEYSNVIANMYNELYLLDIKDKKNSLQYDYIIDFIKDFKEKEKEIYNSMSFEQLEVYFEYFVQLENEANELNSPISKILFKNNQAYIITRIINQIDFILKKEFENDEISVESIFPLIFSDDNTKEYNIERFQEEVYNTSIIFLDDLMGKLDDTKDSLIIKILKLEKYRNSFYNTNVEEEYLYSNFNLGLYIINRYEYTQLAYIPNIAYNYSFKLINTLLSIKNNRKKFIINLSLLKACLYFLSRNNVKKLIDFLDISSKKNPHKKKIMNEMKDVLKKLPE